MILLYLGAIVAANLLTATFGPGMSIVNAFLFIGLDLTVRDRLHMKWHGSWAKLGSLILAGSVLSYAVNRDAGMIAVASCVAFGLAALTDTLIFARLKNRTWFVRANGSNAASALVDSIVFPTIAFGSLMPLIILGQYAAKVGGGFIWSVILRSVNVASNPVRI